MYSDKPFNIFWTGGWDSTFRLLYVLLVEKKPAVPIYIVDFSRRSTLLEFKAIARIKAQLLKNYPDVNKLLFDTKIIMRSDIVPNKNVTAMYYRLAEKVHLGRQYEWLPRFADQYEMDDIELGLIARQHENARPGLQNKIEPDLIGEGHDRRLRANLSDPDVALFRYFRFPLFYLTKNDMEQIAREHGFYYLLENIWFCHRPLMGKYPCGKCAPCRITKRSGHSLGKIPWILRFLRW